MTRTQLVALAGIAVIVAACGGGGSTPSPATQSPSPSAAAETRIEVTLSDDLKMTPSAMTIPAEMPVTFVVTNAGSTQHEFFVGDMAAQDSHEQEMVSGGMVMDEPTGIGLDPGQTKELTMTFQAGGPPIFAGCHYSGHFAAGMKATIDVAS